MDTISIYSLLLRKLYLDFEGISLCRHGEVCIGQLTWPGLWQPGAYIRGRLWHVSESAASEHSASEQGRDSRNVLCIQQNGGRILQSAHHYECLFAGSACIYLLDFVAPPDILEVRGGDRNMHSIRYLLEDTAKFIFDPRSDVVRRGWRAMWGKKWSSAGM